MAWYFFINPNDGDLVSEGSTVPSHLTQCLEANPNPACAYVVREVAERPDWTQFTWDNLTRALVARPVPILIDRLDDMQARFLNDADFVAVWNGLNATRRTQLRTGISRVLAQMVGALRFRRETDRVEFD